MILDQVIEEVKAWQEAHKPFDVMQMLPHYVFQPSAEATRLIPLADIPAGVQDVRTWRLNDHSLTQLLNRLKIPKEFYDRCPVGLKSQNVNWFVQNHGYDKSLLVRAQDDGVIRALLTGDYERFDHLELLELLRPFVTDDAVLRWKARDDMVMHLSFTYPNTATEVKVGDVVETGLHISNSEVGVRSVTIAAYVYRLACRNGAISPGDGGGVFRLRHTGDGDLMRSSVQSAMTQVFLSAKGIVERMKKAITEVVANPENRIRELSSENRLTKAELQRVLQCYAAEPGTSVFEVSQAFSRAAEGLAPERCFEFQTMAVDVLPSLN